MRIDDLLHAPAVLQVPYSDGTVVCRGEKIFARGMESQSPDPIVVSHLSDVFVSTGFQDDDSNIEAYECPKALPAQSVPDLDRFITRSGSHERYCHGVNFRGVRRGGLNGWRVNTREMSR